MKYCTKCGKEIHNEAVICPGCGCSTGYNPNENGTYYDPFEDNASVGLCILSFFIPLFGIIYWAIKGNELPHKAKACGVTAIISWVISFIFGIVLAVALPELFLFGLLF